MFSRSRLHQLFNDQKPLKTKWLLVILVLLFLPQVFISHDIAQQSMMPDLHSRIIGTQLMKAGRPAYFFQWQQGDDIKLYDPNISLPYGLDGVTAFPFALWLQEPLTVLSYCNTKTTWWVIEEWLLFFTLLLTWLIPQTFKRQIATIVLSGFFFCYSRNWWLHVYNGQYYIAFAFFFSVTTYLNAKKRSTPLVLFPVFALVRPFFGIAVLPWIFINSRQNFKWLVVGGSVAGLLLFASGTVNYLPEYQQAMKRYAAEIVSWKYETALSKTTVAPANMEGCVVPTEAGNKYQAGCLFPLQHYLRLVGISTSNTLFFMLLLLVFIACFFWTTGLKKIGTTSETMLLTSFFIYLLCELFAPANRNPYNMVQYLGVLGLITGRASVSQLCLFTIGLALNHDLPFRFAYQREVGEMVMLLSVYLILAKPETLSQSKQA